MRQWALILALTECVFGLICTKCPYSPTIPHSDDCRETCEGDVCYIVVNEFFNGTVIAGCLKLLNGDQFGRESKCHRETRRTVCGCTSTSKCNDPQSPLANFEFTDEPILTKYQILPQIEPAAQEKTTFHPFIEKITARTTSEKLIEVKSSMIINTSGAEKPTKPPKGVIIPAMMSPSDRPENDLTVLGDLSTPSSTPPPRDSEESSSSFPPRPIFPSVVPPFLPYSQRAVTPTTEKAIPTTSEPLTFIKTVSLNISEADKPLNLKPPITTKASPSPSSPTSTAESEMKTNGSRDGLSGMNVTVPSSPADPENIISTKGWGTVEETELQSTVKFGSDNRIPKDPNTEESAQTSMSVSSQTLFSVLILIISSLSII